MINTHTPKLMLPTRRQSTFAQKPNFWNRKKKSNEVRINGKMKTRGFITDQIVLDHDFTCQILHSQVARNFPNRSPKPKTTKKTNKLTPILRTIRRESNLSFFGFIDYGVDLSFFLDLAISELKKTNEKKTDIPALLPIYWFAKC